MTLGELGRRMDLMHADVQAMRSSIVEHTDLDTATRGWERALAAHEATSALRDGNLDHRLTTVEAWQTWALRLVVGAVLMAGLGYLLVQP